MGGYEISGRSGRRPDRETWGYRASERSGRRPDWEIVLEMDEKVAARSASGLKTPKKGVILNFKGQNASKSH